MCPLPSPPSCLQVWALFNYYNHKLMPQYDMRHRFGTAFGFELDSTT